MSKYGSPRPADQFFVWLQDATSTSTRSVSLRLVRFLDDRDLAAQRRGFRFAAKPDWARRGLERTSQIQLPSRLARVRAAATRALGDGQAAEAWVSTPLEALGGRAPLAIADSEHGVSQALALLARLERERAEGKEEKKR